MALKPWSRFLKPAVLGDCVLVEVSDALLGGPYGCWLLGLARDMPGRHVHLDLDEVERLSEASLSTLLRLHREVLARGGRLRLCNLSPSLYAHLADRQLSHVLDAHLRTDA